MAREAAVRRTLHLRRSSKVRRRARTASVHREDIDTQCGIRAHSIPSPEAQHNRGPQGDMSDVRATQRASLVKETPFHVAINSTCAVSEARVHPASGRSTVGKRLGGRGLVGRSGFEFYGGEGMWQPRRHVSQTPPYCFAESLPLRVFDQTLSSSSSSHGMRTGGAPSSASSLWSGPSSEARLRGGSG